ncbi:MAG: hypothetical protein ACJ0O0_01295, partial [Flavobacteriaceae bacterium]
FLLNELEDANLVPGEQDDLESKLKLYKNSEQIKSYNSQIEHILYSSDGSLEEKVFSLNSILNDLSKITNQYDPLKNRLNSILIELNDIQSDLNNSNFDFSDNSFEIKNIEDRINLIYSLQKKHNLSSVEDLIEKKKKLKNKLDDSSNLEADIKDFEFQIETKNLFLRNYLKKFQFQEKKYFRF